MKLRLTRGEIRVRLSDAEVNDFAVLGRIDEGLDLDPLKGPGLVFSLEAGDFPSIHASFTDSELAVHVPADLARRWTGTDLIAIEADQETGSARVRILVEKDLGTRSAKLSARE